MNIIQAIKIDTGLVLPDVSDLGLFAVVDTNSVLRWTTAPLCGVSDQWSTGMIAKGGIGARTQQVDCERGGNSVIVNNVSIRLNNSNQLISRLKTIGVTLTGLLLEIHEFLGTDEDSDSEEHSIVFTGIIEDVVGSETTCSLSVAASLSRRRKTNLSTVVNKNNRPHIPEGVTDSIIPVIFGQSDPVNGRCFKTVKTNAKEIALTLADLSGLPIGTQGADSLRYPPDCQLFPCAGPLDSPALPDKLKLRLGHLDLQCNSLLQNGFLLGKYVVCREGNSENVGQYRKIKQVNVAVFDLGYLTKQAYIVLEIDDYFPVTPSGNWDANAENQSYFEIVDADAIFEIEAEPTGGFYSSETGQKLQGEAELYVKGDDKLSKINLSDVKISLDNNSFEFNPRVFDGSVQSIKAYSINPVTDLYMYDKDNLEDFNLTAAQSGAVNTAYPGVWVSNYGAGTTINNAVLTMSNTHCDRNSTTYLRHVIDFTGYPRYWIAFGLKLPKIKPNVKFEAAYLLMRLESLCNFDGLDQSYLYVSKRRFIGGAEDLINTSENVGQNIQISNLPDSYFLDVISSKNHDFYVEEKTTTKWSGHKMLSLNVGNAGEYNAIHEMLIMIHRNDTNTTRTFREDTRVREIAVAFETSVDISGDVFV